MSQSQQPVYSVASQTWILFESGICHSFKHFYLNKKPH